ncbi:MAG: hypothetical protein IPF46_06860 [Saprospiraceae bacterium]|nr:hypothetical protein [Candidatus Vicinibacter affinis]
MKLKYYISCHLILLFGVLSCTLIQSQNQNTNVYFRQLNTKRVIYSSLNGSVIINSHFKDLLMRIEWKQSDKNVQSNYYEDELNRVWFSTYQALHVYIPELDDFEYEQVTSSNGDTIKSDYKVIAMDGVDLYFKAGDEFFMYDVCLRQVIRKWSVPVRDSHDAILQNVEQGKRLYYSNADTLYWMDLNSGDGKIKYAPLETRVGFILGSSDSTIYLGMNEGELIQWNTKLNLKVAERKISNQGLAGMCWWGDHQIIISDRDQLIYYDVLLDSIVNKHYVYGPVNKEKALENLLLPYVDPDSILWIGSDGYGVVSQSLKLRKFKWINRGNERFNVVGIFDHGMDEILSVSRNAEVGIYSLQAESWKSYSRPKDPALTSSFIKASLALSKDRILMADWDYLISFDVETKKYLRLTCSSDQSLNGLLVLKYGPGNRIFTLASNVGLVELFINGSKYSWKPVDGITMGSKPFTYFDLDSFGNIYLGNNDESILFYKYNGTGKYSLQHEFPIPGGVKDVVESTQEGHIWLVNDQGLYDLNIRNYLFTPLQDQSKSLHQVLYCVVPDTAGYLWMSSNSGILRFSLLDSSLHYFKEKVGLQNYEFNSFAYLTSSSGFYFMGGIDGINYFNPYELKLSGKKAPIDIYSFKINDEETKKYGASNVLQKLQLPYSENTVSFEFLAIDYDDPQATRVKYKMDGVDDDFILATDVKGFARYANLKPGPYKFQIIGSNADQVWNTEARVIELEIVPPFWMTWWFRYGMIFIILGISFLLIRFYYQRQIEKRDQILREQRLIIEKQEAVENERNRIASEMHDDLGSGLTTIRYLSDRALRNVSNQEEQSHIKKIADQSNSLVRNMSEIIWAMNSRFDTLENLMAYVRRYASEYLEEYKIILKWEQELEEGDRKLSGEKRRNVFLTIKEALHNVVKHSAATNLKISVKVDFNQVMITIQDDGHGFNIELAKDHGNGLYNMQKRMKQIGGDCQFSSSDKGTRLIILFHPDPDRT